MDHRIASSLPVTELLRLSEGGNAEAEDQLFRAIFGHLRRLAASKLKAERHDVALEPTELVNEVYFHLFGGGKRGFSNRSHFLAVAARAMHCILVDIARKRKASKRDWGGNQVTLNEFLPSTPDTWPERILLFNDVLERLARFDPRAERIVELRVFVGLKVEEIAEVIGASRKTVHRDYKAATAWLKAELRASGSSRTKARGV